MRVGNWFEGSRIRFVAAVRFIYCWTREFTSISFCKNELGISDKTTIDWNNYMREVVVLYLDSLPNNKIGGDEKLKLMKVYSLNGKTTVEECYLNSGFLVVCVGRQRNAFLLW